MKHVIHEDDVPEVEGVYPPPFDGEKLSVYRDLSRAVGSERIGFSVEKLLPGRRTSFTHAHTHEEELVYVLSGSCHLRTIDPGGAAVETPLRAGHAVSFRAGTGVAHTLVNHGSEPCLLFVVGERSAEDRVFYPEDPEYDAHMAKARPERYWQR